MFRKLITKNLLKPQRLTFQPKYTMFEGFNFDPNKDYFKTLEVSNKATQQQIKKAYHQLAKMYHPDVNKGHQSKFKQINQAYSVLSDSKIRTQYERARVFSRFGRRMGSKVDQGDFKWKDQYSSLSQEQRQKLNEELRRKLMMVFGSLFFFFLMTRRNHRFFVKGTNGELVSVQFEGGMRGGTYPSPSQYPPQYAPQNIPPNYQQGAPYQNQQMPPYQQMSPQPPMPRNPGFSEDVVKNINYANRGQFNQSGYGGQPAN